MRSYLCDFSIIRPSHLISQEKLLGWIARTHTEAETISQGLSAQQKYDFHSALEERLLKIGLGPQKIQERGSVLPDIFNSSWNENEIYRLGENLPASGRDFKERTLVFDRNVAAVFEEFYAQKTKAPAHLIHVTCTGYTMPSGGQRLVSNKGWGEKTVVTHAYHMGCYAAMPALRMARGFIRSRTVVDIVHTEICSLHLNPLMHETEQLVIQSLFADGFIKYSLSPSLRGKSGFELLFLKEELIADTSDAMSWRCENWGLRMRIAKEVPVRIARALPDFVRSLSGKSEWGDLLFALHPGGPKVIEQVSKVLELSDDQSFHSRAVLREMGNMSSATLPHVWDKILKDENVKKGTTVISLAYGPGLSLSGAVLKKR